MHHMGIADSLRDQAKEEDLLSAKVQDSLIYTNSKVLRS